MKLSENGIKLGVTPLSAWLTGPPLIMPNLIKEPRWMDRRPVCVFVCVCVWNRRLDVCTNCVFVSNRLYFFYTPACV